MDRRKDCGSCGERLWAYDPLVYSHESDVEYVDVNTFEQLSNDFVIFKQSTNDILKQLQNAVNNKSASHDMSSNHTDAKVNELIAEKKNLEKQVKEIEAFVDFLLKKVSNTYSVMNQGNSAGTDELKKSDTLVIDDRNVTFGTAE